MTLEEALLIEAGVLDPLEDTVVVADTEREGVVEGEDVLEGCDWDCETEVVKGMLDNDVWVETSIVDNDTVALGLLVVVGRGTTVDVDEATSVMIRDVKTVERAVVEMDTVCETPELVSLTDVESVAVPDDTIAVLPGGILEPEANVEDTERIVEASLAENELWPLPEDATVEVDGTVVATLLWEVMGQGISTVNGPRATVYVVVGPCDV